LDVKKEKSLPDTDVVLRRFESPDETRTFELGRFEVVRIGGMTIGRATYEPGWRWSEHVGTSQGLTHCHVEHIGLVLSGIATAAFADGDVTELLPGQLFYIPPTPHDSWVVGDEQYVSLHFLGADRYGAPRGPTTERQPPGRGS
jgi:quercetin dioxygenase-like cupin family protein